ncbi:hypothetical protein [Carnobacterium funditum]|uniref:hypothetical protein n=1 Tax=Carnobacterium funditum TaxID=2752 RepID=UPI0005557F8C|nr:hypothetical protein [Carnobacterium funditum]
MTITTFIVFLILASVVYNSLRIIKLKEENNKLKKEIEILKKRISNQRVIYNLKEVNLKNKRQSKNRMNKPTRILLNTFSLESFL